MSDTRAEIAYDIEQEKKGKLKPKWVHAEHCRDHDHTGPCRIPDPLDGVSEEYVANLVRRDREQRQEMNEHVEEVQARRDQTVGELEQERADNEVRPLSANERQVGGKHYGLKEYQHWDMAIEFKLDAFQYQVTKYVMRWRDKNGRQDLEKAQHFLQKYIEEIKAGRIT